MNPCFWGGRIWKKWGLAGWYLHWGEDKSAPIRSILKSMKQNETGFSEHESPQKQPSQWKLPLFLCMWWRNKEESSVFSDSISKLEVIEQYWFHCLFYYFLKLEKRKAKMTIRTGRILSKVQFTAMHTLSARSKRHRKLSQCEFWWPSTTAFFR